MRIYFLTRQPDVCQLLADKLAPLKAEIKIYPIVTNLLRDVFDYGIEPDVLFLDYSYYQVETYNPYDLLQKYKKMFPIIFYNHPFPAAQERKEFWLSNLKKTGFFSDFSSIEPILDIMQNALTDSAIAPYVSSIQKPKPYFSSDMRYIEPLNDDEIEFYTNRFDNVVSNFYKAKKNPYLVKVPSSSDDSVNFTSDSFTNDFRVRNHLSHKIFLLFSYLYSKKNTHVPIAELCKILSHGTKKVSLNGLRLAVYRLRTILAEDIKAKLKLISFDHGYMLVE
ncbi:hypothetical protein [Treponema sp.]|uniref:hypothetical protein n=1 Tax=Treponema sp. TaxID=166 RepID=UPI00298E7136|nr:hypothetical protein [Treponema sp.]MCR5614002.1 hypothetical protein [Treponema sp.]